MQQLEQLVQQAQADIAAIDDLVILQQVRAGYLGKKGSITDFMKSLSDIAPADRPQIGQAVNAAKEQIQQWLNAKTDSLKLAELNQKLHNETLDVTLPGRGQSLGSLHPVSLVRERVEALFTSMGFSVVEGPEVEDDFHNFTALNIPEQHPARAAFDTFYFADGRLLRTHTSPVQIRTMQTQQPPLRIIAPGRVYRCDSDATHTPMFNQIEGLIIDENISFADLKGLLQQFLLHFFEMDIEMRMRPSYFPFTEPSAEVDMRWGDNNWLEILGCGMVHPQVLENVGIDSEKYTGFAFGIGLDRLAMLRYGIDDLRLMFENDIRFLGQF